MPPPKHARIPKYCLNYIDSQLMRPMFICKLYKMLLELDDSLIAWDSGRILIPRPPSHLEARLSRYFRHGKLTSLQRQLTNFGFRKLKEESREDVCVYAREDMSGLPLDSLLHLERAPHEFLIGKLECIPNMHLVSDDEHNFLDVFEPRTPSLYLLERDLITATSAVSPTIETQ